MQPTSKARRMVKIESRVLADPAQRSLVNWVASVAKWEVRADLTFKLVVSADRALKLYEAFMMQVIPSVSYFVAVERNPSRSGYHLHAVWADCQEVCRRVVWKRWFERYGRALIEPIRDSSYSLCYLSKSVSYASKSPSLWNLKLCRSELFHRARI